MRLNLKKKKGKYVKSTAKFDKPTAANMPSTRTDTTAYTTTANTGSNTTTTNEYISVRTSEVCRKMRQNVNIYYVY